MAEAIRLAASFPRLDRHRAAILDARSAYANPRFLQQIGRDVDQVKAGGRAALLELTEPHAAVAAFGSLFTNTSRFGYSDSAKHARHPSSPVRYNRGPAHTCIA